MDKTTSEFWERIRRNEPPDEYLNVSPVSTTVILHSNVLHQGRETKLLRQKRILEVRAHFFNAARSPTALVACETPPSVEPAMVS